MPNAMQPLLKSHSFWLISVVVIVTAYCLAFFVYGGLTNVSQDGTYYLARAEGESVMFPFSNRILGPMLARFVANILGISYQTAFHIFTPVFLSVSLAALAITLNGLKSGASYRNLILAAFGLQVAVMYGGAPVLVDPLLIMLAACACAALKQEKPAISLIFVCLATVTKEYGLFFVLPIAYYWWKHNKKLLPLTLLPFIIFGIVYAMNIASTSGDPIIQRIYTMLTYHIYLIRQHGIDFYLKTIVYQSWAFLWPIMAGAAIVLIIKRSKYSLYFGSLLIVFPILFLNDWDRVIQPCVPYAALALTDDPFAQNRAFHGLVISGSVSTSILRLTAPSGDATFRTILSIVTVVVSFILLCALAIHFIRERESKQHMSYRTAAN